jgi:hypothetical protein
MVRPALNAASGNAHLVYKAPRKLSSAEAADQQLPRDKQAHDGHGERLNAAEKSD